MTSFRLLRRVYTPTVLLTLFISLIFISNGAVSSSLLFLFSPDESDVMTTHIRSPIDDGLLVRSQPSSHSLQAQAVDTSRANDDRGTFQSMKSKRITTHTMSSTIRSTPSNRVQDSEPLSESESTHNRTVTRSRKHKRSRKYYNNVDHRHNGNRSSFVKKSSTGSKASSREPKSKTELKPEPKLKTGPLSAANPDVPILVVTRQSTSTSGPRPQQHEQQNEREQYLDPQPKTIPRSGGENSMTHETKISDDEAIEHDISITKSGSRSGSESESLLRIHTKNIIIDAPQPLTSLPSSLLPLLSPSVAPSPKGKSTPASSLPYHAVKGEVYVSNHFKYGKGSSSSASTGDHPSKLRKGGKSPSTGRTTTNKSRKIAPPSPSNKRSRSPRSPRSPYHVLKEEEYSQNNKFKKYKYKYDSKDHSSKSKGRISGRVHVGKGFATTQYLVRDEFDACERTCRTHTRPPYRMSNVLEDDLEMNMTMMREEKDKHASSIVGDDNDYFTFDTVGNNDDDGDDDPSRDFVSQRFGTQTNRGGYHNSYNIDNMQSRSYRGQRFRSNRYQGHSLTKYKTSGIHKKFEVRRMDEYYNLPSRHSSPSKGNRSGKGTNKKEVFANAKNQCCKGGVSFLKFKIRGIHHFGGGSLSLVEEATLPCSNTNETEPPNSSKGERRQPNQRVTPPLHDVTFMDCNDPCIDEPSIECSTESVIPTMEISDDEQHVCIGKWNPVSQRLELDTKMPHSVPLHFNPYGNDRNKNNNKKQEWMTSIHTSCSQPIFGPYGISFSDSCEDVKVSTPFVVDDSQHHNATTPNLIFQDGISPIYYHHKRTEYQDSSFQYRFAECKCGCKSQHITVNLRTAQPSQMPFHVASVSPFPTPPSQSPTRYSIIDGSSQKPSIGLGVPERPPGTTQSPSHSSLGVPKRSQSPSSFGLGVPERSQSPSMKSLGVPIKSDNPSSTPTPIGTSISKLCNSICEEWIANNCILIPEDENEGGHGNEPCMAISGDTNIRFLSSPIVDGDDSVLSDGLEYHQRMIDLLTQILLLLEQTEN